MLKIVNPRLGRSVGFPPASAIYYDNSTTIGLPNNVQGAIEELNDKASIIDGEVDYYSDLPTASEHIGETYLVKLYSVLTPTKLTGLYYCDGSIWDRRSDKVVYSSTAFTTINKLVKTKDNNRQIIETAIEIDENNNLDLKDGGLKDTNVITAVKLGDTSNIELQTSNKTIVGSVNELVERLQGGTLSPAPIYLTPDTSSVVGTYKQLNYTMPSTQTILSTVVNNNEVLINTYLYDLPVGDTKLPAGEWIMEIYGYVSQTTLLTKYKVVVFKRTSAGVETDLFTINSNDVNNTTLGEINFEGYQPEYTVNATDYLGMKLYANTTAATNITVYTYLGDSYHSYITAPLSMRHDLLRGLKYTTSNEIGYSHLSNGTDTIYGVKTFNSSPIVPTPTTDMQAATKKYVDDNLIGNYMPLPQTTDNTKVGYYFAWWNDSSATKTLPAGGTWLVWAHHAQTINNFSAYGNTGQYSGLLAGGSTYSTSIIATAGFAIRIA